MKILLFELDSKSGANIFNRVLFRFLKERGYDVTLRTLPLLYEPFLEAEEAAATWLGKRKQDRLYDIIHAPSISGAPVKANTLTFHLLNAQSGYLRQEDMAKKFYWNVLMRKREERSIRNAKAITAVSAYTAAQVKKVYGVSADIIYNGIDTGAFIPYSQDRGWLLAKLNLPPSFLEKKILLFVGNATGRKGFDILKSTMRLLDDSFLCLTCGLRTSYSEEKIVSLGSLAYERMPLVYNLCDLYVHPARLEGFGLSVAEAMGCAKPVVCGNVACLPELVEDKKGGILCDLKPEAFKQAIEHIMRSANAREEMGMYNRQKCLARFDYRISGQQYLGVYEKVLKG